jgi:hypothetical protein
MNVKAVLVVVAAVAFGAAPLITEPFRGYDPQMFRVVIERPSIQPAGWAFAIWGLIYAGLIVHAVAGLIRRGAGWDPMRLPLATALIVGAGWLWIAPRDPWLATLGLWVMMATAIGALLRGARAGKDDRWLRLTPVALFAGWLTAAMNVSLGVVIAGTGVLTDTQSALLMLATTLAIALAVLARVKLPEYGATVIWALAGIVAVNLAPNPPVAWAALGGAVVVAAGILWTARQAPQVT